MRWCWAGFTPSRSGKLRHPASENRDYFAEASGTALRVATAGRTGTAGLTVFAETPGLAMTFGFGFGNTGLGFFNNLLLPAGKQRRPL